MLPSARSLLVLLLAGCTWSNPRIAGSIPLPPGSQRTLRVTAPEPKDLTVELWNRGPGRVTFRRVQPTRDETGQGVLAPGAGELRWQATTAAMAIELLAESGEATVGYAVFGAGSIHTTIELK